MAEALPARQAALLEELTSIYEEGLAQPAAVWDDFACAEAIHRWQAAQEARCKHSAGAKTLANRRLAWLRSLGNSTDEAAASLTALQRGLDELQLEHREFERSSAWLHQRCHVTLKEQSRLSAFADELFTRLEILQCSEPLAEKLDSGANLLAAPEELDELLGRLESSALALESRYDFVDAQRALSSLAHLRNRVCILLRSSLQRALEGAEAQLQELLFELQDQAESTSTVDTQIFYTNFHMISPSFRPALVVLLRHSQAQPQYATTLDDLERFFSTLRLRLVADAAAAHWASLRESASNVAGSLPQLARQCISYLMDTTSREQRCFEAFFPPRATQEALEIILTHLGALFQQAMQPACASASWVDLAATAEVLKAELTEQWEVLASRSPVRSAMFSLLGSARRRLAAEARRALLSADLSDDLADLRYPEMLFKATGRQPKSVSKPLALLAASYQVLEVSDFEALMDIVASSSPVWLRDAARKIEDEQGVTASGLDGRLFLLRNLLALQEQLAAFEDDSSALGLVEATTPHREDEFTLAFERQSASELRRCRGRRGAALRRLLEEIASELLAEFTGLCVKVPEALVTSRRAALEDRCCHQLPAAAALIRAYIPSAASVLFGALEARLLLAFKREAPGEPWEEFQRRVRGIFNDISASPTSRISELVATFPARQGAARCADEAAAVQSTSVSAKPALA